MGIESHLLRMLEPAVRPDGVTDPSRKAQVPFEARDFDSLLAEARDLVEQSTQPQQQQQSQTEQATSHPLGALSDVRHIENQSLRQLMAGETQRTQP